MTQFWREWKPNNVIVHYKQDPEDDKDKYVVKGQNKNVKKKKSSLLPSNFPGSHLFLREHIDSHEAPLLQGEGTSPALSLPGIK